MSLIKGEITYTCSTVIIFGCIGFILNHVLSTRSIAYDIETGFILCVKWHFQLLLIMYVGVACMRGVTYSCCF